MKKGICSLLIVMLILTAMMPAGLAAAGSGDVICEVLPNGLPENREMPAVEEEEILLPQTESEVTASSTLDLTVSVAQQGSIDSGMTWIASASGGDGNYSYEFTLSIPEVRETFVIDGVTYHDVTVNVVQAKQEYSSSNSFSFQFVKNGIYKLSVWVKDGNDHSGYKNIENIVVQGKDDPLDISVARSGRDFVEDTVVTVNATGGDGNYSYQFWFYWKDGTLFNTTIASTDGFEYSNRFTYRLSASGNYSLHIWVKDGNGQEVHEEFEFSAQSAAYPSVPEKAQQLAAECAAAGCKTKYEKALWMHDWLISHADYDHTYTYYGPDGVLCLGTGVCQSYCIAYAYLMEAVGIPCDMTANANHAWNMIELGGEWFFVDTTWDDPTDAYTGTGGIERHLYFCVPQEVIVVDHGREHYCKERTLDSYRYNYYVMRGDAESWANDLSQVITDGLQAGDFIFTAQMPDWYAVNGEDDFFWSEAGGVLASGAALYLCRQRSFSYGGRSIRVDGYVIDVNHFGWWRYIDDNNIATFKVDCSTGTLTLPKGVKTIGSEAFRGDTSMLAAVIPDGATAIRSNAFAGCSGLWKVVIPDSVTTIESNAFDSANGHLTLIATTGSKAESYAQKNGLKFFDRSDYFGENGDEIP